MLHSELLDLVKKDILIRVNWRVWHVAVQRVNTKGLKMRWHKWETESTSCPHHSSVVVSVQPVPWNFVQKFCATGEGSVQKWEFNHFVFPSGTLYEQDEGWLSMFKGGKHLHFEHPIKKMRPHCISWALYLSNICLNSRRQVLLKNEESAWP